MDKQSWDDSIKSVVATPSVLDMMSSKLDWTQALGNAVLAQQPDVMDAVQRLRAKAQANNKLISTPQQTVTTEQQDGQQAIVIAPTEPDTIYVPYYDPSVVFGPWPYPDYPPYYWPAPGYIAGGIIATGIAFGAGYALGRWVSGGYRWGGGLNWGNRNININRSVNVNNINVRNNNWTHNPVHRQGVRYTNANVAQKFGGNRNVGGASQTRMDFRGSNGQQVLKPGTGAGGNRGNLGGANPGGGNFKGNLAGGNRPAAVTRPAGKTLGNAGSANRARVNTNQGQRSSRARAAPIAAVAAEEHVSAAAEALALLPFAAAEADMLLSLAGRRRRSTCGGSRRRRRPGWRRTPLRHSAQARHRPAGAAR